MLQAAHLLGAERFIYCGSCFEYGDGAHNGKHGGAILPESLRWLWRETK